MKTALVTGTIDHIHTVVTALKSEGFEVIAWEGATPGAADGLPPGSADCYVQLAPAVGVGTFAPRIDTVARVAPLLAPDAAVVLVAAEPGWDNAGRHALQALAGVAVAKRVGRGVRVAVVDTVDPGDITAAVRRERTRARGMSLVDLAPEMAYADWRNEVFNLTSGVEYTYFGWRLADGARRAAVLRRSVLSPLPGAEDGAHGLARAVLTDALGGAEGGDLREWADSMAADFLDEVIGTLPEEGFELPIQEVAAWVVRRSLSQPEAPSR